jgi:hypothetical protein
MRAAEAVLFESPPSLAVEVNLPNRGRVSGMGIRKGVTLIVGGGFHGKTTLLKALEAGVYNKVRHNLMAKPGGRTSWQSLRAKPACSRPWRLVSMIRWG